MPEPHRSRGTCPHTARGSWGLPPTAAHPAHEPLSGNLSLAETFHHPVAQSLFAEPYQRAWAESASARQRRPSVRRAPRLPQTREWPGPDGGKTIFGLPLSPRRYPKILLGRRGTVTVLRQWCASSEGSFCAGGFGPVRCAAPVASPIRDWRTGALAQKAGPLRDWRVSLAPVSPPQT